MVHGPYNFIMRREPECPICRRILLPVATIFADGTAFCQSCFDNIGPDFISQVIASQNHESLIGQWTTTRGLRFFTPHGFIPTNIACHLLPLVLNPERPEQPPPEHGEPRDLKRTGIDEPRHR